MSQIKIKIFNGEGFFFSEKEEAKTFHVNLTETAETDSLLDICEKVAEVALPFGCRSGTCGSCRIEILSGKNNLKLPGAMELDTLTRCQDSDSVRLSCRAHLDKSSNGTLEFKVASPVPEHVFSSDDDATH